MNAQKLNTPVSMASQGNGIVALAPLTPHIQHAEELISSSHRRRYPSKSTIIYAGDTSDTLYYIIKGSLRRVPLCQITPWRLTVHTVIQVRTPKIRM